MGRNTDSCRTGYNVRAKLYQSQMDSSLHVIRKLELANAIVFYAKDHQNFKYEKNEFSGVMQRVALKGYIETMDLGLNEIKVYDTVEYGGKKYDVEDVTFIDNNTQKEVSNRPTIKTIIKLGEIISG